MANTKQNFMVVEINPHTHETKSIPFDKVYIYDNVLFSDFYENMQQALNDLEIVKAENETLKANNTKLAIAYKKMANQLAILGVDVSSMLTYLNEGE